MQSLHDLPNICAHLVDFVAKYYCQKCKDRVRYSMIIKINEVMAKLREHGESEHVVINVSHEEYCGIVEDLMPSKVISHEPLVFITAFGKVEVNVNDYEKRGKSAIEQLEEFLAKIEERRENRGSQASSSERYKGKP